VTLSHPSEGAFFRGHAAYAAATPWTPGWAIFATVIIILLAAACAAGLMGVAYLADSPLRLPGMARAGEGSEGATALATLGAWQAAAVLLTLLASVLWGGRPRGVLALRTAGSPWVYVKAVVLMVLLQTAVSTVQQTLLKHDLYVDLRPFVELFKEQWGLAFLVVGIGAPLSEELLFRGFLLSALARSRLGFAGAAILSSALWTALHAGYSATGIAEVFLIGLFFSWLLWRTGSLWVPIFCHALYNSLLVVMLRYLPLPASPIG
jgi:uncharacterized protein